MPIGSLIQQARNDTLEILQGDFSVELTLTPDFSNVFFTDGLSNIFTDGEGNNFLATSVPTNGKITIQGLATRHSTTYNPDTGLEQVGENCHCSFSEKVLNDLGFATRNAKNKLIIKDWIVSWSDITGIVRYKIKESYPDETLGLIRCQLALYE